MLDIRARQSQTRRCGRKKYKLLRAKDEPSGCTSRPAFVTNDTPWYDALDPPNTSSGGSAAWIAVGESSGPYLYFPRLRRIRHVPRQKNRPCAAQSQATYQTIAAEAQRSHQPARAKSGW